MREGMMSPCKGYHSLGKRDQGRERRDDTMTEAVGPRNVPGYLAISIGWTWALLAIGWLSGTSADEPPVSWLRLVSGIGRSSRWRSFFTVRYQ